MARPLKRTAADRFTSTDMSVAGGIAARSFKLLVQRGLAPRPASGEGGQGGTRLWDGFGLSQIAMVGALNRAGVGLLVAAQLGAAFAEDFASPRGHFPSRLDLYVRSADLNPHGGFPWPEDRALDFAIGDHFWLHHLLRRTDLYKPGEALEGDVVLEIADRTFAVLTMLEPKIPFLEPLARVLNWERGEHATVRPIYDEVGSRENFKAMSDALDREYRRGHRNALGILRVNVSLAIRSGYDALHDHRISTAAPVNWAAGPSPKHHYQEVGPDGWPVATKKIGDPL